MTSPLPKILLIDDTPANLMTLGAALAQEFDLRIATSGPQGLELAAKELPDLILLDIMMPDMDGFEVCSILKSQPAFARIPVVFVTAMREIETETRGLALGAADYITKPINVEIARQRIRNLISHEQLFKSVEAQKDLLNSQLDQLKKSEESLRLAASVFSSAQEAIMITDVLGTIVEVNESFCRITGYTRAETLGQNPRMLHSGRQSADFYDGLWGALRDKGHWYGEVFAVMQTIGSVRDADGSVRHYVSLFSDITTAKLHQKELEHIAHYDALTGLPNRALLADRLRQALYQSNRRGLLLAVAFLDLDGFKRVNDQHGHEMGDRLLNELAKRMRRALRDGDTLARIGGDEFVAVMGDLPEASSCVPMLSRLLEAASLPVLLDDVTVHVSASVGVTFNHAGDGNDADLLVRQADQAMYQAKLTGKNRFHVFDAALDRSVRGHHENIDRIRLALERREFLLHYQPKVDLRRGGVVGAEALIRWQHPERGLLEPVEFLPVIEDHTLAIEVGEWVMAEAMRQLTGWQSQGIQVPVSINVGALQLQQPDFVQRLEHILSVHPDLDTQLLEIEILETSALEDISGVSRSIEHCRRLGIKFALDDFGTGYSSLSYLKRLPVAALKIDQSFVKDMLKNSGDLAILKGVIGLAEVFQKDVIAEGVETMGHGDMLVELGCNLAQGFGIARPMAARDFPLWLEAWNQSSQAGAKNAGLNRQP